jgi:hypothetical protein
LRIQFQASVPKELAFPESNEDYCELGEPPDVFALSDGATESFDSKRWARFVVEQFVRRPEVTADWLEELTLHYSAETDPGSLTWAQAAAYERGSFASLLGVRHNREQGNVEVVSIGDSFCALIDGQTIIGTLPYTRAEEFNQRPQLVSSKGFTERDRMPAQEFQSWHIQHCSQPLLACMTDALGRWFLEAIALADQSWSLLTDCATPENFTDIVVRLRREGRLKVDDTTLVILAF